MKSTRLLCGAVAMAMAFLHSSPLRAETILEDNFESGVFSTAWSSTAGGAILTGSGAAGSARHVSITAASSGPGGRFDSLQPGGSAEFTVECHVRVQSSSDRQFNLILSTATTALPTITAAFNLRYQNGWAVFDGAAWQPVSGLGSLTPGAWHRLRISGHDWGASTANCDIELSDANGSTFTSSATGLTWFQSPSAKSSRASYFVFTTSFGGNPGFEVDEVLATVPTLEPVVQGPPPPPISGIYPHLSISTANQSESGIGAVVPWADRLYAINYFAAGYNADGVQHLFEIDADLNMIPRGLPFYGGSIASRMIHDATNQLLIGPYFIDATRNIRQIPIGTGGGYTGVMPMHLSGVAKDVSDPNKVHFVGLAMERGWADVSGNDAVILAADFPGQWVRFTLDQSVSSATAYLSFGNGARPFDNALTASLATPDSGTPLSQGVIRVTGASDYPLEFAADFLDAAGQVAGTGYYRARVTPSKTAVLGKITDATAEATLRTAAEAKQDFTVDAASVVLPEGAKRFRVPKGNPAFDAATASGWMMKRPECSCGSGFPVECGRLDGKHASSNRIA